MPSPRRGLCHHAAVVFGPCEAAQCATTAARPGPEMGGPRTFGRELRIGGQRSSGDHSRVVTALVSRFTATNNSPPSITISGGWKTKPTDQTTGCLLLALLDVNGSEEAPMHRGDWAPGIVATNAVARRMASASASARVKRSRGKFEIPRRNAEALRTGPPEVPSILPENAAAVRVCRGARSGGPFAEAKHGGKLVKIACALHPLVALTALPPV